jgi:DNA topoisomerase-1
MTNNKIMANYWMYKQFGSGKKKWETLEHNGVLFPPEYVKHDIPVFYKGVKIILDKDVEELATLYAKYLDTDYVKSKTFNKNFWAEYKKVLGKTHQIQDLENIDFSLIHDYLVKQRDAKKELTKEEKDADKEIKDKEEEKYKTATVDGKTQPVGNFRMEPPGIFIGRGDNPKLGKIKPRIYPEDIIINIGKEAKIPDGLSGHKWKKVVHDKEVEWLASWKDVITGKIKYVWLGAQSDLKARSDMGKFDLARKLRRRIKSIRRENEENMYEDDIYTKQIATALYFIDKFALRVGNEKGDDETDTVGVTSLRVEHVELLDNYRIRLDFLGKDSVRFNRILVVDDYAYNNIQEFIKRKTKGEQLFDKVTSNDVNKYLQSFMPNLTAKVFRTFNSSYLFQKELNKITQKYEKYDKPDRVPVLLDEFNKANAKVAVLCNHQKNITKSSSDQIDKINDQIKKQKSLLRKARDANTKNPERIKKIQDKMNKLKLKKELRTQLKNISLGTSKVNYIDPRIAVAFMKLHDIPIDKVFSKTLQEKFRWAMEINTDYKF